jgi:hypothetical protein
METALDRVIVCIRWGTAFSSDDVNLLYRACRSNVSGDLRFVCLTDNPDGLHELIEARDIPDIGLSAQDIKRPGVWRKICLYAPELHDLGRALFIDLDMIIVGSLDQFFDVNEGVVMLNTGASWRPNPSSSEIMPSSGVFSFDPAQEWRILQEFQQDPQGNMDRFRNEQDFVAAFASSVTCWPEGLVTSFKRHHCHRNGLGLLRKPAPPAPGTAIVAFHGTPRPRDTMEKLIWGPFPHWHLGKVSWISDYWDRYSA